MINTFDFSTYAEVESVTLFQKMISIGNSITFLDILGDEFKSWKTFDLSNQKMPSFNVSYKYIFYFFRSSFTEESVVYSTFGPVSFLFNNKTESIKKIFLKGKNVIAVTSRFIIELNHAIKESEIVISSSSTIAEISSKNSLFDELKEIVGNYSIGLISKEECLFQFENQYLIYFTFKQKDWRVNYHQAITGKWYPKEEHD